MAAIGQKRTSLCASSDGPIEIGSMIKNECMGIHLLALVTSRALSALLIAGVTCAGGSALPHSPIRVEHEFSVQFAQGAVALSASERQRFATEINRITSTEGLCRTDFTVVGFGDRGHSIYSTRALAVDRARYVKNFAERLGLGRAQINIGEDAPVNTRNLGSARVYYHSSLKPWC